MEENLDINNKEISDNATKSNIEEIKEFRSEKNINMDINNGNSQSNPASKVGVKNEIDNPVKPITKPKKELPIEKKPFQEFIKIHLIPSLIEEINQIQIIKRIGIILIMIGRKINYLKKLFFIYNEAK